MSSTRIANPTATVAATTRAVPAAAKGKGSTLLALYLTQLATNPLRTKCITAGTPPCPPYRRFTCSHRL